MRHSYWKWSKKKKIVERCRWESYIDDPLNEHREHWDILALRLFLHAHDQNIRVTIYYIISFRLIFIKRWTHWHCIWKCNFTNVSSTFFFQKIKRHPQFEHYINFSNESKLWSFISFSSSSIRSFILNLLQCIWTIIS